MYCALPFAQTRSFPIANAPIAVLDSGVGGIGVLREIHRLLPAESLLYFGDSANAPYGERTSEALLELISSHAARLLSDCKALVLACNTATAVAAEALRRQYPHTPVIGMEPALKPALAVAEHPKIVVLATAATLRERKFQMLASRYAAGATLYPLAAPGLVRLVESGRGNTPEADAYLRQILAPFWGIRPDAVVLGCTHFPFAIAAVRRVFGEQIPVFDGAKGTAKELERRLTRAALRRSTTGHGHITLRTSAPEKLPLYRSFWLQTARHS